MIRFIGIFLLMFALVSVYGCASDTPAYVVVDPLHGYTPVIQSFDVPKDEDERKALVDLWRDISFSLEDVPNDVDAIPLMITDIPPLRNICGKLDTCPVFKVRSN